MWSYFYWGKKNVFEKLNLLLIRQKYPSSSFNSSQFSLSNLYYVWSYSLLSSSSCLTPLLVFVMLQSKKQKHHHHCNHKICDPPQPNPFHSLSLLSWILSLLSQPWLNPWAPPPFLVVVLTCATTTTTSDRWPPLFLSTFISTFSFL